jgi:hypothetical protein
VLHLIKMWLECPVKETNDQDHAADERDVGREDPR